MSNEHSGQQDPKEGEEDGYMGDTESSRRNPRRRRVRRAHSPALGDAGSGFDAGASASATGAGAAEKPVAMPYGMPSEAQLGLMKALAGFAKDAGGGKGGKA